MGKRKKSSRVPIKKIAQTLDTSFNCLFCNHEKSITCILDKKNNIGSLSCKICGQNFQTRINGLSQAVDIYNDWFDAVEEINEGRVTGSEEENSDSDYESNSESHVQVEEIDSDEEELEDDERINVRGRNTVVSSEDDE